MKSRFYIFAAFTLALMMVLPISCSKEVDSDEELFPLSPSDEDADAGTWDLVGLTSITQVAVPAPAAITSDAYLAELAAIKDMQSKLNDSQRDIIEYWSAGGVLRWNQIFRELVARYNLPPAPRADNTYPAPDAENPFADPNFPFSNPPYAARAYSYASAAQYDALKAAWHYKYQYNRPAPYKTDAAIQSLMPESDLPAYPSEEAVMSGAAADILKSMFPAALEEITLRAAEQRNAALWSGKATTSDISAGLALGKGVAAVFIARAGADGMRNAVGTKPQWDALKENAVTRGETPWISLDLPSRPPMLPFFSQVRGWMMTPADFVNERPLPPPPTASAEMAAEVEEVLWYSKNLTRERLSIVHKWADGVGTYTPPGHWNDIAAEHIRDAKFSEVRAARAFALLNMTMHDAAIACWDAKFFYFNPRPTQLNPEIKTGTGIPNFPAYVSGHSTFSASASTVLAYLFPAHASAFDAMSEEAAMSRLYGGIHYRADCEAGTELGKRVGSYTVNFALQDGAE